MTASTEVAVRRPQASAIPAKLAYARELANSGLLPAAYRKNPANVLWAVEYGEMLGLPPMAAMTGVHVIEGKPTASAGLISGLVRRAGHKLRVWGTSKSATCEIVRSDDPEHTFSVTWTLRKAGDDPSAEEAGLLGKTVWKQYPASMLKSRAITQCARDACEEVLFGLHYTPEELGAEVDEDGAILAVVVEEPPQAAVNGAGTADDPWYVRPAPEDEDPWLKGALEVAPGLTTIEACRALWEKSSERVAEGTLAMGDAARLQGLLRVRVSELGALPAETAATSPVTADPDPDVLDPDDPWAAKVEELGSEEEARDALLEAAGLLDDGQMMAEHYDLIEEAVLARFPAAAGGSERAA